MEPIKIVEENFINIDPQILLDPKWYQDIEDMIISVDSAETADYSKEYAIILADKLFSLGESLNPDLLSNYLKLLKVLRLGALLTNSDNEKEKFFREQILELFEIDFVDVKSKIDFIFRSYYDAPEIIEDLRKHFLLGLEKNKETLGRENIKVTISGVDKLVNPTLQNWLVDYNSIAHIDLQIRKRSGYEQVNYLTHSPNALRLNKEDRDTLLKILQFYDWLRFDPLRYNFLLPGQPSWEDKVIDIAKPQQLIPEELVSLVDALRLERQKTSPSQSSSPYAKAEKFRLPEEATGSQESSSVSPGFLGKKDEGQANPSSLIFNPSRETEKQTSNEQGGRLFGQPSRLGPPPKAVNIQDILKQETGSKNLEFRSPSTIPYGASKDEEEEKPGRPGLKLWEGRGGQIPNSEFRIPNKFPNPSLAGNEKAAQLRAASGSQPVTESPNLTLKNSIANNRNLGYQKPAEAGLVDSNAVFEPGLSSNKMITQDKNVVKESAAFSGGDEGNRTPRAMDDNPGSAPRHPHLETLYHPPQSSINKINQSPPVPQSSPTTSPASSAGTPPPRTPTLQSGQGGGEEIDKKLEELKKRTGRKTINPPTL